MELINIENKIQELRSRLISLGIEANYSESNTDYGQSFYFVYYNSSFDKLKIRISDHCATNTVRIENESMYSFEFNVDNMVKNIEKFLFPERYVFVEKADGNYMRFGKRGVYEKI